MVCLQSRCQKYFHVFHLRSFFSTILERKLPEMFQLIFLFLFLNLGSDWRASWFCAPLPHRCVTLCDACRKAAFSFWNLGPRPCFGTWPGSWGSPAWREDVGCFRVLGVDQHSTGRKLPQPPSTPGSVGGRCVLTDQTLVITSLLACRFPHLFCEDGKTHYRDYVIVGNTRYMLFPQVYFPFFCLLQLLLFDFLSSSNGPSPVLSVWAHLPSCVTTCGPGVRGDVCTCHEAATHLCALSLPSPLCRLRVASRVPG